MGRNLPIHLPVFLMVLIVTRTEHFGKFEKNRTSCINSAPIKDQYRRELTF